MRPVAQRSAHQLELPIRPVAPQEALHSQATPDELRGLREQLPPTVQFGTCGWVYPGWAGIVWAKSRTATELERDGLIEYATHPLLTTMYLESGPEAEASERDLRRYAAQLPQEMHCILEVHRDLTTPRFGHGDAAERRAGQVNPLFLDARFFVTKILQVYRDAFGARLGPFLFTFPPVLARAGITPEALNERLTRFFSALPPDVDCAIELREPDYLTIEHAYFLSRFNVSHVLTTWHGMPPLDEQARLVPTSPEIIIQVVDPSGKGRARRERLLPFDAVRAADAKMRETVVDVLVAMRGIPTYVLVHNEAEGSAPLTIVALARMLQARLGR
jgi:uncharacterized protein YecE (DUF72 family)